MPLRRCSGVAPVDVNLATVVDLSAQEEPVVLSDQDYVRHHATIGFGRNHLSGVQEGLAVEREHSSRDQSHDHGGADASEGDVVNGFCDVSHEQHCSH